MKKNPETILNLIKKDLKEAYPIEAYSLYKKRSTAITKEDFIKLCKDALNSRDFKNTMRSGRATKILKHIIESLENNTKDTKNIFDEVIPNVDSRRQLPYTKITIHQIKKKYPQIIFGEINTPTETNHIDWFKDYSKHQKSIMKQDYIDTAADLREISEDMGYMDRDQKIDAIASRYNIVNRYSSLQKSIKSMGLIANEPFFARIDFSKINNDEQKVVYISKIGEIENYPKKQKDVDYADWRAPIGNLFYRTNDALGKTHFMGEYVDIILNGRIIVRDGNLVRIDANSSKTTSNSLSHDILQEKLSQSSSAHMNEVVETIQVEQNAIIRHTGDKNLIVQGVAGSGKTIIGIHRIAYLMYAKSIQNKSILFVSPNQNFSDYISHVLPELGENNMPIITMSEIVETVLASLDFSKSLEDFSSFVENYFNNSYNLTVANKYTDDFNERFWQTIKNLNYEKVSLELKEIVASPINFIKIHNRKHELEQIYSDLLNLGDFADYYKYENSVLAAVLWAKINNVELKLIAKNQDEFELVSENDVDKIDASRQAYDKLMKDVNRKAKEHTEEIEGKRGEEIIYKYTEAAIKQELDTGVYRLISRTWNKKTKDYYPTKNHINVLHVVIDEAQDYSPWHIYLLKTVFKHAHFTILGDENQNLNPYNFNSKLTDLLPDADYIGVRKAYRSSPEIVEYTNRILKEDILAIRKPTNIPVEEITLKKLTKITNELLSNSLESIYENDFERVAIICRDLKTKKFLIELTKKHGGVEVLTTYEAKGLEFDAVIVIDTYASIEKELFYTACTRAQHQLIVYRIKNSVLKTLWSRQPGLNR